jgi:hypothetical protein
MKDSTLPDVALEVAITVGEVVAAALAGGAGLLLESNALTTVGDDLTLGLWSLVFGAVLVFASLNLAGDALSRVRALG